MALSDELKWTAQATDELSARRQAKGYLAILHLLDEHDIEEIVIGLPKNIMKIHWEKQLKSAEVFKTIGKSE